MSAQSDDNEKAKTAEILAYFNKKLGGNYKIPSGDTVSIDNNLLANMHKNVNDSADENGDYATIRIQRCDSNTNFFQGYIFIVQARYRCDQYELLYPWKNKKRFPDLATLGKQLDEILNDLTEKGLTEVFAHIRTLHPSRQS